MRTPYVGETVHFYSFPPSTHPGPQAAIVAFVWKDDESVNLMVIDPHGSVGTASGVEMLQAGEDPPEKTSYCEFITQEERQPDKVAPVSAANIEKNIDTSKPNPYASPPK